MLKTAAVTLAIALTAATAYAMRPLPDSIPMGNVIWAEPEPALPSWEKVGTHWRNALPSNAGPTASWGPLICDKPWCKDGSGFGWWNRDVAGPYNKTWPEAKRRIEAASR